MNTKSLNMSRLGRFFFAAVFLFASKAALATITFHNYEINVSRNTWYIGTYNGDIPDVLPPNSPGFPDGSPIWKGVYDGWIAAGAPPFAAETFAAQSRPWATNTTLAEDFASALASQRGVIGVTFFTGVSGSERQGAIVLDGTTASMASYPIADTRLYAFATSFAVTPAPVPEIDGKMLPQVALLLGSLYLLFVFGRRTAGRVEPSGPALAQAV